MRESYLQQKNNIFIKKDLQSFLKKIDTLVFDVDGVLVNVDSSYYQTIIDTVQYYFCHMINMQVEGNLIDKNIIMSFKLVGGFNDDWELAAAIVLYYLWKIKKYHIKSSEELKKKDQSVDHFVKRYLSNGGGLKRLVDWVEENSSNSNKIFSLWNREKIFQIAKEFYAGERHCFRLYRFYPKIVGQIEGNIEKETRIIEPQITEIIKRYHVGILTGRNRSEAKFVMKQIGWSSWINPETVVTSEDYPTKPTPDGLEFLLGKFQSRMGLYIGDTMDDLLTVKNLNRHGEQRCLSALVLGNNFLSKKGKKEYYMENNVDLLAANVNQVVELVHDLSQ